MWNGGSPGQLIAQHHHPGDPEEDDVVAGLHDRARVVAREVGVSAGQPSVEKGHRPRAEPRVEDVRVLLELGRRAAADVAGGRAPGSAGDRHVAVRAVPGRDAMAPPQLAAARSSRGCSSASAPQTFSKRSGRIARPAARGTAASGLRARGSMRMNHCVLSRGSMTSLLRWQRPMTISCGAVADEVAARLEVGHDAAPRRRSGRARRSAPPVA